MTEYLVAAIVALFVAMYAADQMFWRGTGPDPDRDPAIEHEKSRFLDNEISRQELEDRVAILTNERCREVYDRVERVDHASHDVAIRVARQFGSLDALAAAEPEDLEDVHGVGESISNELQHVER